MKRAVIILSALAVAPVSAGVTPPPLHPVPFVGCPSDGQLGPQPAPETGNTSHVRTSQAAQLAYYSAGRFTGGLGVLAPRGWHCFGLSGSNGIFLIVTPEKHKAEDFLGSKAIPIRGPAVEVSLSYGATSGRYAVMDAIGRYFHKRSSFIRKVKVEGLVFGPIASRLYPADIIRKHTDFEVRFTTPANKKGEGTSSRLAVGPYPTEGILTLLGDSNEKITLFGVNARLPSKLQGLTEAILSGAEVI